MWIYVVIDDDYNAVKAFYGENAEEKAQDFADEYYLSNNIDCIVKRTYLRNAD